MILYNSVNLFISNKSGALFEKQQWTVWLSESCGFIQQLSGCYISYPFQQNITLRHRLGNSPWSLRRVQKKERLRCISARTKNLGCYLVSGQLLNALSY